MAKKPRPTQSKDQTSESEGKNGSSVIQLEEQKADRLAADGWTQEETLRAEASHDRKSDDIPQEKYALYQSCIEETLQKPDEVWSLTHRKGKMKEPKIYHFIKYYDHEDPAIWFVIIARETEEDDEQLELLDAFPTKDLEMVDRFRTGLQEVGGSPNQTHQVQKVLH